MATVNGGGERFEMGRVLQRAFGAIGRQPLLYLGLAAILAGIPQVIGSVWRLGAVSANPAAGGAAIGGNFWIVAIIAGLLSLIGGVLLQVAVTRATVIDLSGDRAGFAQCLKGALRLVLPMIGLTILLGLGVGLATLLLIVPGIMLYVAWSVAVPAYVQERIGVMESFGRSAALTKGARWKIFALLLVCWIAAVALQAPTGMMVIAARGAAGTAPLMLIFSTIISIATSMAIATIQATIYVELRDVKEGASPADLELIFA